MPTHILCFLSISVLTCCDDFLHRLISHTQLDNKAYQHWQRERHLYLLTTELRCGLLKGKTGKVFRWSGHFARAEPRTTNWNCVWVQRESSKTGRDVEGCYKEKKANLKYCNRARKCEKSHNRKGHKERNMTTLYLSDVKKKQDFTKWMLEQQWAGPRGIMCERRREGVISEWQWLFSI